jgi:hypothetical protein
MSLIHDSTYFLDSVRLTDAATLVGVGGPTHFFGPKTKFQFIKDNEYTVSYNIGCANAIVINPSQVDVYLVGSAMPVGGLGFKLASYKLGPNQSFQDYGNETINFTALATGQAVLRFVVWAGNWNVSKVSVSSANEEGFNPDQTILRVPIVNKRYELLKFRVDLFDANNNHVPTITETDIVRVDGGNTVIRGPDARIDGAVTVAGTGSDGLVITSVGYTASVPSGGGATSSVATPGSAIYYGQPRPGTNSSPIFIGSSPVYGSIVALGEHFKAASSGSGTGSIMDIHVSGVIAVLDTSSGLWTDVRLVIQEAQTQAEVNADFNLNYSSSIFSASIAQANANAAAASASANIVDATNRIVRPNVPSSSKTTDGLYMENAALGFWKASNNDWPVIINSGGQFRFANPASYVGGADPYTEMIGFANGAFIVRTKKLFVDTPAMQIIGSDVTASAANKISIGGGVTLNNNLGFYADGAGNFRVGTDATGSNFIQFVPGGAMIVKSQDFYLSSSLSSQSLQLNTSFISLGSPAPQEFNPQTLVSGAYFNRAGQFFIGAGANVNAANPAGQIGNFISFGGSILNIRAEVFRLSGGGIVLDSSNNGTFALGTATSLDAGQGIYMGGNGTFRIGTSTGSPTSKYIKFDGATLYVQGDLFTTDPAADNPTEFKDIKKVIMNNIAFGAFGFYISNL